MSKLETHLRQIAALCDERPVNPLRLMPEVLGVLAEIEGDSPVPDEAMLCLPDAMRKGALSGFCVVLGQSLQPR